ncbi:MAG: amylo-alpha-1,6-glucosidase [Armatimonadetes bacterium]|nr:amylo-alpha-1,6-glucosidase [Armatimonadota bacterium]
MPSSREGAPAREFIHFEGDVYVLVTAARGSDRTRVLKRGDTFGVFDRFGDIQPLGFSEHGLYHAGARYLSRLELLVEDRRPMLLNSAVRRDNVLFSADLTNPDILEGNEVVLRQNSLHIFRARLLWEDVCYEKIRVSNYRGEPFTVTLLVEFEADFADEFEVRGARRSRRGELLPPLLDSDQVVLAYRGLDQVVRRSRLSFLPAPDRLEESSALYRLEIEPRASAEVLLRVACDREDRRPAVLDYETALAESSIAPVVFRTGDCEVETSHAQFNHWLHRSAVDLHMMVTHTPWGPYPYAGVPWFSTAFGRDGLITAHEYLWVNPQMAQGVLRFLAAHQASQLDPENEAAPGKILHETRQGEMAALGEVPLRRYYGSVDSTPLFLVLAGAYYQRTGDRQTLDELWPSLERALEWVERYGDRDGDGFVEYQRQNPHGLFQQGWKDAGDSIFHQDGSLAEPPIALCEVQGFVYQARRGLARILRARGEEKQAERQLQLARQLREKFHRAFWLPELETFALALDGRKQPCRVKTSNAGYALLTGIARRETAEPLVRTLFLPESFSGWGIRTVAQGEARYNPMAYHNGTVWPHDNALIAMGCSKYGYKREAGQLLTSMFEASTYIDQYRLPELMCGFVRRSEEAPTLYPVACTPQAWSAAAPFFLLQACLGLEIEGEGRRLRLKRPYLPSFLHWLEIRNLRLRDAQVDVRVERHDGHASVRVLRSEGDPSVSVEIL